ncbi:MAG: tetratricopeptide repeat protein [Pirellulaceae bacterium]|nr:tetratricopeptide repeat protein [Pirellulaceae bacterium]
MTRTQDQTRELSIQRCLLLVLFCSIAGCASSLITPGHSSSSNILTNISSSRTVDTELSPEQSAEACIKTAHQLDSQHHNREAIALYERARGFDPKRKNLSRRLAVLYAQVKDTAKAKLEFANAIAETPKDASLRSDAGYFYLESGDIESAEKQLVEARKLSPGHSKGTIHLAMLRAKQERLDESYSLFEEAVGPASAHSNLGVLLAKFGRRDLAVKHLEEANRLDPELPAPPAFLKHFRTAK